MEVLGNLYILYYTRYYKLFSVDPRGYILNLFSAKLSPFFYAPHVSHKLCLPNPTNTLSHPTSGPHPPNPRPCFGAPLQNILLARSQSFDSQPYTHSHSKHNAPQLLVLYTIVKLVAKLCCIANKLLVVVPHHTSHKCFFGCQASSLLSLALLTTSSLSSSPFM